MVPSSLGHLGTKLLSPHRKIKTWHVLASSLQGLRPTINYKKEKKKTFIYHTMFICLGYFRLVFYHDKIVHMQLTTDIHVSRV